MFCSATAILLINFPEILIKSILEILELRMYDLQIYTPFSL